MMDFKKVVAPQSTITQDLKDLDRATGNIYESVAVIGKRANRVAHEMKQELNRKLEEFAYYTDNLEEVFENREQIEICKYYERLPKPVMIATQEFVEGKLHVKRSQAEESSK